MSSQSGKRLLAYARLHGGSNVAVPVDVKRALLEAANNAHSSDIWKAVKIMSERDNKGAHTIPEQEEIMRVASKITALGAKDNGTPHAREVMQETKDLIRGSSNFSPLLSALNSLLRLSPAFPRVPLRSTRSSS